MKFSIKDFFSKCDQICRKLQKGCLYQILLCPFLNTLCYLSLKLCAKISLFNLTEHLVFLLKNVYALLPENVLLLVYFDGPRSILSDISWTLWISHKIIFVSYFLKVTKTCKRYFWEVSEASHKRRLFWNVF